MRLFFLLLIFFLPPFLSAQEQDHYRALPLDENQVRKVKLVKALLRGGATEISSTSTETKKSKEKKSGESKESGPNSGAK